MLPRDSFSLVITTLSREEDTKFYCPSSAAPFVALQCVVCVLLLLLAVCVAAAWWPCAARGKNAAPYMSVAPAAEL